MRTSCCFDVYLRLTERTDLGGNCFFLLFLELVDGFDDKEDH